MRLEYSCYTAFFFELLLNLRDLVRLCVFALRSIVIFNLIIIFIIEQLIKRQVLLKDLIREVLDSAESSPLEGWAVIDDARDGLIGEFVAPTEVELFEVGTLVGDGQDALIV